MVLIGARGEEYPMARVLALLLALSVASPAIAQDVLTAQGFFAKVSARFGNIRDYSCDFHITVDDAASAGRLYFQAPNLLRLDFSEPTGQVLLSDGKKLFVYVPSKAVVLSHPLSGQSEPGATDRSPTPLGLRMLVESYDIAYLESPTPQPLDDRTKQMVTKLRLTRRSPLEMHREIVLSISEDLLIRRWESTLEDRKQLVWDITNIRINQGIPPARFRSEPWSDANEYTNFLTDG
jgi:outer membrane lipoprotein-sorting protein